MKMNKKKIASGIICALLLGASTVCEVTAATGTLFDERIDIDSRDFSRKIETISRQKVYFLVPKDPQTYKSFMGRLDAIQEGIRTNESMTLRKGWSLAYEYVDILLNRMATGDSQWADDAQQKEIIDRLLNVNALFPRQPKPHSTLRDGRRDAVRSGEYGKWYNTALMVLRHESGGDRLSRFVKKSNIDEGALIRNPNRLIDLFSKLAILGMGEYGGHITRGALWNGNMLDADHLWRQEFEALYSSLSNFGTTYLQPALDTIKGVLGKDKQGLVKPKADRLKAAVSEVEGNVLDLLDLLDTSVVLRDDHQKTIERLQVRALAKKFFVIQTDVNREEMNKSIRDKRQFLEETLIPFGQFFFQENAENKFMMGGVGSKIYGQIENFPVNSARFKALARFLKVFDREAYEKVPIAGEIYREGETARRKYLDQLTQRGPEYLSGINWYESNNFDPTLKVQSRFPKLPFDVKVIDFKKENEGTFWDENRYSHGEVVKEVFKDYSGGIEPTLVALDDGGKPGDDKRLVEILNSIKDKTLINMSISFREDQDRWSAFANCLKRGNIIFLSIKNEGEDLGTGQDDVAKFFDFLSRQLSPDALRGLYLVSRVSHNPVLKWEKDKDEYFAVLDNGLVSQGFGKSSLGRDLAAFVQSRGSAAGGDYYSRKYNKHLQGTSFATPAQAGAMVQVLLKLMQDGKDWKTARTEANDIFESSLRKNNIYLRWNVSNAKGESVKGEKLDPSIFGRGMFDYENLMASLGVRPAQGSGNERPLSSSASQLPRVPEKEDPYGDVMPTRASGPDKLIKVFGGASEAGVFLEKPEISAEMAKRSDFIDAVSEIPSECIAVTGVQNEEEAKEIAKNLPAAKIDKFEYITGVNEISVSYEEFRKFKPEDIEKVLKDPSKKFYVNGVLTSDLSEAINATLQYGDRLVFDHPLFKNMRLSFKDFETLDKNLLKEYAKNHSVRITDVPSLGQAIALQNQWQWLAFGVDGFYEFFKEGNLSLEDFETLDQGLLKEYAKSHTVTITGVSSLDQAIALAEQGLNVQGFGKISKEGRISVDDLQSLDQGFLKEYIKKHPVKVTGVSSFDQAIVLAEQGLNVQGFDAFFKEGKVSVADMEKIGVEILLKCGPSSGLKVIGCQTLEQAMEVLVKTGRERISMDFDHLLFKKKELSVEDVAGLDPTLFKQYERLVSGIKITGVPDLNVALDVVNRISADSNLGIRWFVKGFEGFFENGLLSYAEFKDVDHQKLKTYMDLYKVNNVDVTGIPAEDIPHFIETMKLFGGKVTSPDLGILQKQEAKISVGKFQSNLGQLPKDLKALILNDEALPKSGFKALISFGQLEAVRLAYEVEDRKDLLKKVLPALQNMKHLSLVEKSTELTDAEHKIFPVKHLEDLLKSLPSLESVRIENTSINPNVFEGLQKKGKTFGSVQSLKIPQSIATEKSVKAILALFPALQELQVKGLQDGRKLSKDLAKLEGVLAGRDVRVTFS